MVLIQSTRLRLLYFEVHGALHHGYLYYTDCRLSLWKRNTSGPHRTHGAHPSIEGRRVDLLSLADIRPNVGRGSECLRFRLNHGHARTRAEMEEFPWLPSPTSENGEMADVLRSSPELASYTKSPRLFAERNNPNIVEYMAREKFLLGAIILNANWRL